MKQSQAINNIQRELTKINGFDTVIDGRGWCNAYIREHKTGLTTAKQAAEKIIFKSTVEITNG